MWQLVLQAKATFHFYPPTELDPVHQKRSSRYPNDTKQNTILSPLHRLSEKKPNERSCRFFFLFTLLTSASPQNRVSNIQTGDDLFLRRATLPHLIASLKHKLQCCHQPNQPPPVVKKEKIIIICFLTTLYAASTYRKSTPLSIRYSIPFALITGSGA